MPAWLIESTGEHKGRMHSIEPGKAITIGRAPDSDIAIMNAQISRHHATIWQAGGHWWVEDQRTKNGTLLNGRSLAEPAELSEGDEIALPGFALTFHIADETMTIAFDAERGAGRPAATKTFLFADLRDYTSFVERHGDSAAGALVATYRRLVRAEIARSEGVEVKTEGDSFFVVFDSARRAVDCAVGIVRAAERHADRNPEQPVRVGVGVHAGEPLVQENDYVGSAVNLAARLAQNARSGEVLVTDVVRGLLRTSGLPAMEAREGLVLKGIDDPPRIYTLAVPVAPKE